MASRTTRDDPITQLLSELYRPTRKLISKILSPPVRSPLILLLILLVAGTVGYYIGYAQATNAELPIDVVHNVTITDTYTKPDPAATLPFLAHPDDFIDTLHPGSGNGSALIEVFKDVDEGAKHNSGDVFALAHNYALNSGERTAGKAVTLVVTGTRDPAKSQFRNVIIIEPEP